MKYLIMLICTVSFAQNQDHSQFGNDNNVNNCNPVLKCNSRHSVVYRTKVVRDDKRVQELEQQVLLLQQEKERLLVLVHVHPKVVEKLVVRDDTKKNAISLLGALSTTKLAVSQSANSYNAKTEYQPDLGLMYQRDFRRIRASIGVTLHGTGMLGIGLTF